MAKIQKITTRIKSTIFSWDKKKNYQNALIGNTGIDCFDFWVNELLEYGYLHNHARMWFASIWIHTLNLPWQLGADFFLKNLLDGDTASNTLSWRWVAGLHTQGKNYIATESNINKYTNNRFNGGKKLSTKPKNLVYEFYEYQLKNFDNNQNCENNIFLINLNQISYEAEKLEILSKNKVCIIESIAENKSSELVKSFNTKVIKDYTKVLKSKNILVNIFKDFNDFNNFLKKSNYKKIHTFYPGIGRQNDTINSFTSKYKYEVFFEYDKFDQICWPHASSGFFLNLKKKIPFFIEKLI